MPKGYLDLICAIFQKTYDDYADLKKNKVSAKEIKDEGSYSIREINKFLRSEWCQTLLEILGGHITGVELLDALQKQYT